MSRLAISVLILALSVGCASTTTSGTLTQPSVAETTSSAGPTDCPEEGCPIPDCHGGMVVNAQIDHVAGATGVKDVDADVEEWIQEIGGTGDATGGLPTPQGRIAFLVTRDGSDVAMLSYVTDGHGGWLRASYVACESELERAEGKGY